MYQIFNIILTLFCATIILLILLKIVKSVSDNGFTCGYICILTMMLFYFLIPVIYLISAESRDNSTLFNLLLEVHTADYIILNVFICTCAITLFWVAYEASKINGKYVVFRKKTKKGRNGYSVNHINKINKLCEHRVKYIADISLILGGISIFLCIISAGGFSSYLALGSITRGVGKDSSLYINSALLPLITLSTVIIIAPYLYKYILSFSKKSIWLRIKLYFSFMLSVLYLLYNQGRVPLILFFVPFILDLKITKKMKLGGLLILVLCSIPLLNVLSALFTYFSYGYWNMESNSNVLQTLLLEFTYPFSNFINKGDLVKVFGFRWGLDYIQWPLLIIPSFLLKIFAISKGDVQTIGSLNTSAYSELLGMSAQGGIPTDFLTFNYYQFGIFAIILSIFFFARILNYIDRKIFYLKDNSNLNIIILRICFLLVSLINNFDFSVIFRMRFDLLLLIYVVFYVFSVTKDYRKRVDLI